MARFDNKVVLVSGGARGQGAAEARLLVAQGAKVVIGDVLDNQGQSLAVELGPAASFVRSTVRGTEGSNPPSSSALNPGAVGEKPRALAAVCGVAGRQSRHQTINRG